MKFNVGDRVIATSYLHLDTIRTGTIIEKNEYPSKHAFHRYLVRFDSIIGEETIPQWSIIHALIEDPPCRCI